MVAVTCFWQMLSLRFVVGLFNYWFTLFWDFAELVLSGLVGLWVLGARDFLFVICVFFGLVSGCYDSDRLT